MKNYRHIGISVGRRCSNKTSSGLIGSTCLDSLGVHIVIFAASVYINKVICGYEGYVVAFTGVFRGVGYLSKARKRKRICSNLVKVTGGSVMVVIMQAVGICKMSVFAAKLLCLVVHHLNKIVNVAPAHIVGKHHCGVVA